MKADKLFGLLFKKDFNNLPAEHLKAGAVNAPSSGESTSEVVLDNRGYLLCLLHWQFVDRQVCHISDDYPIFNFTGYKHILLDIFELENGSEGDSLDIEFFVLLELSD